MMEPVNYMRMTMERREALLDMASWARAEIRMGRWDMQDEDLLNRLETTCHSLIFRSITTSSSNVEPIYSREHTAHDL